MKISSLILFLALVQFAMAQNPHTAQLKQKLMQAKDDTSRVLLLSEISVSYRFSKFDSSMWYGQQGLQLARRIHYTKGEGRNLANVARILAEQGNTPLALKLNLEALQLNQESEDWYGKVHTLNSMGLMFLQLQNYSEARAYFVQTNKIYEEKKVADDYGLIASFLNMGMTYLREKRLDSAEVFLFRSYELLKHSKYIHTSSRGNPAPFVVLSIGQLHTLLGNDEKALYYYRQSVDLGEVENDLRNITISYQFQSDWFRKNNQPDSSRYYAYKSLQTAKSLPFALGILNASTSLLELYKTEGNKDSTLKYMSLTIAAKDSLFNPNRIRQIEMVGFTEQQRLRQVEEEQELFNNRVKLYALLSGLAVLLFGSFIQWRNNRQQKKANALLQQQKDEIAKTFSELKVAQSQLIQSEKMASLGELTAGIAHEIQNPLNFVNNFSEVSNEMIQEIKEQRAKSKDERDEALESELLEDISKNLEKISHHGKRADFIVKGMLQHSRTSTGERQLTNINMLADEFLKLSYHGLRAKDKSFNAELITNLDPNLPKINVVQQEIGRVLLNLFNNAFYAVKERAKNKEQGLKTEYKPTVEVSTSTQDGFVIITVKDNGIGIPEGIKEKIMQPFFTTKPTGEGTGLGLSLSYDIIKAHGGELKLETKDGEFAEFIIQLPVK